MSGQEVCVIIIPNDFPEEKDEDQKSATLQVGDRKVTNVNEKEKR